MEQNMKDFGDLFGSINILFNRKNNIELLLKLINFDVVSNFIKNITIIYKKEKITIEDFEYDDDRTFNMSGTNCIKNFIGDQYVIKNFIGDQYVTKNGTEHYNYKLQNGEILDNIPLDKWENNTSYNYIIIKDNNKYIFRLGKVTNLAELGVKHGILGKNSTKYVAGEIRKLNNKIEYNFNSSGFGITLVIVEKLNLNHNGYIFDKKVFIEDEGRNFALENAYKKLIENILKQLDNANNYDIVFNENGLHDIYAENYKDICFGDDDIINMNNILMPLNNCIDLKSNIVNNSSKYIDVKNGDYTCKKK